MNATSLLFTGEAPLIDMVVCVFSVGRRPATLETYQSASSRPIRGGFLLLYRIYVEIFGGRKFRETFEAQNPHPEIFDPNPENFVKSWSHRTRFAIKWIFSQSVGVRVDRRRKPTYQLTAARVNALGHTTTQFPLINCMGQYHHQRTRHSRHKYRRVVQV
jgi:hypothetical protein